MKIFDLIKEDGRIVKGVNTTVDVSTDEIKTQAAKFGNTVDKDGRPPTLSSKVKGKSTNVLFNLRLGESRVKQLEASYEGNIGIMELMKFFSTAPSELVAQVKQLIKQKKDKEVWKIVQQYTNTKLKGKEFGMDEGEFRANDVEEFKPDNKSLNNLKSKYLPDWEMLDHRILQAKYVADDHRAAVAFVKIINSLSEQMDHFCEVTQDVAEVTVKTTTFDVKGLTILDFQIAMVIDRFANDVGIKQVPMSGNFGMHENFADGKVKGKSRPGRVKKSGASCNGSVTKLRKQAKNASGEKAKMYHWCANMKSGKKK
jgi:pterin-4a-carbinolamine dehydratase